MHYIGKLNAGAELYVTKDDWEIRYLICGFLNGVVVKGRSIDNFISALKTSFSEYKNNSYCEIEEPNGDFSITVEDDGVCVHNLFGEVISDEIELNSWILEFEKAKKKASIIQDVLKNIKP
jgi:hypothetical protein